MDDKHSDEPVPLSDLISTPAETPREVEVIDPPERKAKSKGKPKPPHLDFKLFGTVIVIALVIGGVMVMVAPARVVYVYPTPFPTATPFIFPTSDPAVGIVIPTPGFDPSLWNSGYHFVLNEDVSDQPAGTRVMLRGSWYDEHETWYTVMSEAGVVFNARQSELEYAPLTPTP